MRTYRRRLLTTPSSLRSFLEKLPNYPKIGLDTESSGPLLVHLTGKKSFINIYRSYGVGISIACPDGDSWYMPVSHRKGNASLLLLRDLLRALARFQGVVAIHNAKHERDALRRFPVPFQGFHQPAHCTQVLAWLVQDPRTPIVKRNGKEGPSYALKEMAKTFFGIQMKTFSEVTGGMDFSQLTPKEGLDYACEDAEVALELHDELYPQLALYEGMLDTYHNVELPLIGFIRDMEDTGVGLDRAAHGALIEKYEAKRREALDRWNFIAEDIPRPPLKSEEGEQTGVSISSNDQLQAIYEAGYWPKKGTSRSPKTGKYKADDTAISRFLEILPPDSVGHQLAKAKAEYALYDKLVGTYGYKMAEKAGQYPDLNLHPQYLHTGTATGRFSSSYPNFQNIPVRTEEGRAVRKAFISPIEGWKLMSADYSQIELRVMAHFARRGMLYDAYVAGEDVHQRTADKFGTDRSKAKILNFAPIYGAGATKMAGQLGVTVDQSRELFKKHKAGMPEVFDVMKRAADSAAQKGYVRTLLGRIRKIPGLQEARDKVASLADRDFRDPERMKAWLHMASLERLASNTPIQGGARDVMTLGMLRCYESMDHGRARVVGQVHDDLILAFEPSYEKELAEILKVSMESAYKLRVPLVAEPVSAWNWADMKD